MLTVPGNHDLVRPNTSKAAVKLIARWDEDPDVSRGFWDDPDGEYRAVVEAAFANYVSWAGKHTLPRPIDHRPGTLPGDFAATVEKGGVQLGIVGLNSAFLQLTGANFSGKLVLDARQFHGVCDGDGARWAKRHDVCLLMTHHPPDWLSAEAKKALQGEVAPPGRFAVHLFGHMHEARTQVLSVDGNAPWRYWQGASLFGLERWGEKDATRSHGYSAGQIRIGEDRGHLRIWPRIAVQHPEGFWRIVPDVATFNLEGDLGTRPEEITLHHRAPSPPSPSAAAQQPPITAASARPADNQTEDAREPARHSSPKDRPTQWRRIAVYALISLGSFLCGVGLLCLLLWKAEMLGSLGLIGNIYYLVLLPMGLAAAGFLFGVLQSFASYRGKQLGGVLKLGGPFVGFALVVIGGFVLVPSQATFALTVYVHGQGGPHDLVLKYSGDVLLDLGPDRRAERISDKGQAYFPAIPASYRGQEVPVGLSSDDFEIVGAMRRKLDGISLYLPVQRKPGYILGRVQDQNGDAISGATVSAAGHSASTDDLGDFKLTIPGNLLEPSLDLQAVASGYASKHYNVTPNASRLTIILIREP